LGLKAKHTKESGNKTEKLGASLLWYSSPNMLRGIKYWTMGWNGRNMGHVGGGGNI